MSRPRVCIVTNDPDQKGGSGGFFRAVFATLHARGDLDLEVLSLPPEGERGLDLEPWSVMLGRRPGTREGRYQGAPVLYSGSARRLEALAFRAARANWLPRARQADAVLAVSGTGLIGWPLTGAGMRFVVFTATSLAEEKKHTQRGVARRLLYAVNRPLLRRMEGQVYREAALIFTLSPGMDGIIAAESGVPRSRFRLFPVPVDTDRYSPDASARPGTVVWMARQADPRKHTALLVEAAGLLAARHPELRLVLAGGPLPAGVMDRARSLGLAGRVEAPGWVDEAEKIRLLRSADIFAIPSEEEGLCIAGLEAMACGAPVVSTRCIGPEVFVQDGVNGYLVERGDAAALAGRLSALLADRALRDRMSAAARRTAVQDYSPAAAVAALSAGLAEVWPEKFGRAAG